MRRKLGRIILVSVFNITLIYCILWSLGYISRKTSPSFLAGSWSNKHKPPQTYKSKLNFTWLHHHPVYHIFNISKEPEKPFVNVLVIVSSAPSHEARRNAIRNTWWTQCRTTNNIIPVCIFSTDHLYPDHQHFKRVQNESLHYKDIRFQQGVPSGVAFGLRYINHMVFAVSSYQFDYLLRLDDDQFFCMERFLKEVPETMVPNFHWGWVHFRLGVRRPEESIIFFSRDVIEIFLTQGMNRMLCHPWADQMIAIWLSDLGIKEILRHDYRIHHHPPPFMDPSLKRRPNVCQSFLAIHGAYPEDMFALWGHHGDKLVVKGNLEENSSPVFIVKKFNWTRFFEKWRYKPKLCVSEPQWNTSKQMGTGSSSYTGREFQEDIDFYI